MSIRCVGDVTLCWVAVTIESAIFRIAIVSRSSRLSKSWTAATAITRLMLSSSTSADDRPAAWCF